MKVSYKWLASYFKEGEAPEAAAVPDLLNFHIFEVESAERLPGGDTLFDVKVLPNRAHDALSHWSIAWELASITGKKLETDFWLKKPEKFSALYSKDLLELHVEDATLVPRAAKRVVEVNVSESPLWLKDRLATIGQRSINAIVDATNYLTHELGQPVHAFDYDKLAGEGKKNITVRHAKEGEKVTTLDGKTFTLEPWMLVIADSEKALDIAGIKGGNNSGIDENTKRIVLSACTFDGPTIRKTAQKLQLRTDASVRFEHGLSAHLVERAIDRLTSLVVDLASGVPSEDILDIYPAPEKQRTISFTGKDVSRLLGIELSDEQIGSVLDRMGFRWKPGFVLEVPPTRLDLETVADVVEEVGRMHGYEHVIAKEPTPAKTAPSVLKSYFYEEKIREILAGKGFSELYLYSFGEDGERELENPIAANKAKMRSTLASGLSERLAFNIRNKDILGLDEVLLFEIGNVYPLSSETTHIALASSNKKTKLADFLPWKVENLYKGGENILEFNLEDLLKGLPEASSYGELLPVQFSEVVYKAFSPFPSVTRDVAVFVPLEVKPDNVAAVIEKEKGSLCVLGPRLFDTFTKTFPDGSQKTSYAFRLVFQASDRTLTSEETAPVMDTVYGALKVRGWEIR